LPLNEPNSMRQISNSSSASRPSSGDMGRYWRRLN
jgi:hypothetical protein